MAEKNLGPLIIDKLQNLNQNADMQNLLLSEKFISWALKFEKKLLLFKIQKKIFFKLIKTSL